MSTRSRCLEARVPSFPEIFRRKRERGAPWRLRWSRGLACDALNTRVPERVADDFGIGCSTGIRG